MADGDLVSGEQTPSSDGDSVLDLSGDGDSAINGKPCRQDIVTITGRQENCEAAREAVLVCRPTLQSRNITFTTS